MKDRIRKLRKEKLKLSQAEFGRKIGVTQQTVANIESGVNVLTERNFEAICRTWNVNREWLRNGIGEPILNAKTSVEAIMAQYDLESDEAVLMSAFLELPSEYRAGVVAYVKKAVAMFEARLDAQAEREEVKTDDELTPEEMGAKMHGEIDEVIAARKRATITSSVSITLNGLKKKSGKFP